MLLMLQIVATMQMFVEAFILTNGGAGVDNNTLSVVNLIYQYAFAMSGASNYDSASALGVVLMWCSPFSPAGTCGRPASAAREGTQVAPANRRRAARTPDLAQRQALNRGQRGRVAGAYRIVLTWSSWSSRWCSSARCTSCSATG